MSDDDNGIKASIQRNGVTHTTYWCQWQEMRLVEHPHAVVTESDLPCPFFNNVFSANFPDSDRDEHVEELLKRFRHASIPLFWWSGPIVHDGRLRELLLSKGLIKAFEAPAMAMPLSRQLNDPQSPLSVEEITSDDDMRGWSHVCTTAFDFDTQLSDWWSDLHKGIPFGPDFPLRHYVGMVDGRPVATASSFTTDQTVGLGSVGVIPEYRRQGFGAAITIRALHNAIQQGCDLAVLYSSEMATKMYEQIGFKHYGKGECFLLPGK